MIELQSITPSKSALKKVTALIMIQMLLVQSMWVSVLSAEQTLLQGGGEHAPENIRPFVDGAWDEAPIVNINTPESGVSHNTYEHYNVSDRGLVLNNSATITDTQLAGYIEGNPNLTPNNEAHLIINEVVGASQSELKGYTEVAGKKAGVVVANPNGITCDGCGFVNTDRITLTTGQAEKTAGQLTHVAVRQGEINIQSGGIDARGQNQLDILARAVNVHGKVQANNLNVVAGANRVNYQTLTNTPIAGTDLQPQIAVDVAEMGGMYANQIKVITSDQGAGVNMRGELMSAGNLSLDVSGNLDLAGHAHANNGVTAQANSISTKGTVSSKAHINMTSSNDGHYGGVIQAKQVALTSSTGSLSTTAQIQASEGKVELKAKNTVTADSAQIESSNDEIIATAMDLKIINASDLKASGHIRLNATNTSTVNGSKIQSQGTLHSQSKTLDVTNKSTLNAHKVQLDARQVAVDDSTIIATDDVSINNHSASDSSTTITQNSRVTAKNIKLYDSANVQVEGAELSADENISINADNTHTSTATLNGMTIAVVGENISIDAQSTLEGEQGIVLTSHQNTRIGTGSLIKSKNIAVNADTAHLSNATVQAREALSIDAKESLITDNGSELTATVLNITGGAHQLLDSSLTSASTLTVLGQSIHSDNSEIEGVGEITLTAARQSFNQGSLSSDAAVNMTASTQINSAALVLNSASLSIATGAGIFDGNSYTVNADYQLTADQVSSENDVIAADNISITSTASYTDTNSELFANTALNINTGVANMSGSIMDANGTLSIKADSIDSSSQSALTSHQGGVELIANNSGQLSNSSIVAQDTININAPTLIVDQGSALTAVSGGIKVIADNSLVLSQSELLADDTISILTDTAAITSSSQVASASNSIDIASVTKLTVDDSSVIANKALSINTQTADIAGGALKSASRTVTVNGDAVNLVNAEVMAEQAVNIDSQTTRVANSQVLSKTDDVTINATMPLNIDNASEISAQGNVNLGATEFDLINTTLSAKNDIVFATKDGTNVDHVSLENARVISSDGAVTVKADYTRLNNSSIIAGTDIVIGTNSYDQQGGMLWAEGHVTIDNGSGGRNNSINNIEGDIVAFTGNLTLRANSINNTGKAPTFVEDGYIATWTETSNGGGSTDDIIDNTNKMLKDDVLDSNGQILQQHSQAYTDLLSALLTNTVPSEQAQALVKDDNLEADGKIKEAFVNTWNQVANKAAENGEEDVVSYIQNLFVPTVEKQQQALDADGNPAFDEAGEAIMESVEVNLFDDAGHILSEYQVAYQNVWDNTFQGVALSEESLALLKEEAKDGTGLSEEPSAVLSGMLDLGAAGGYDIIKTLTADVLNDDGQLARLISGGSITLDADTINNIHANISARGDISTVGNLSFANKAYGAAQTLHEVHKQGCFTCHTGDLGYRETFGGQIEAGGNIVISNNSFSSTIDATSNKGFDFHIDELHDSRDSANPVPENAKVLLDVSAEEYTQADRQAEIDTNSNSSDATITAAEIGFDLSAKNKNSSTSIASFINANLAAQTDAQTIERQAPKLGFPSLNLEELTARYSVAQQLSLPYLDAIESNDPYIVYGAFLSSDYLMNRLPYSAEHEPRMQGDEWYLERLNSLSTNPDSNDLLSANNIIINSKQNIELDGQINAQQKLELSSDGQLSSRASIKADITTINADSVEQKGGSIDTGRLDVIANKDITLSAANIKVSAEATLQSNNGSITIGSEKQHTQGMRGRTRWENSRDLGTTMKVAGNLTVTAQKDLNVEGSSVQAQGIVTATAVEGDLNVKAGQEYQEHEYTKSKTKESWGGLKKKKTTTHHYEDHTTHYSAVLQGEGGLYLVGGQNINIEGAELESDNNISLNAQDGNVNISKVVDEDNVDHNVQVKKSFVGVGYSKSKQNDTLHAPKETGSTLSAGGTINISSSADTNIVGSIVVSVGNAIISAQGDVNIDVTKQAEHRTHSYQEDSIGFSNTDTSLSFGRTQIDNSNSQDEVRTTGSMIGSITGELNISADQDVSAKGAALTAMGNVNITGANVHLQSAQNTQSTSSSSKQSFTGVTASLGGTAGDVVNNAAAANNNLKAADATEDQRVKELRQMTAARNTYDAIKGAGQLIDATDSGKLSQQLSVNLSVGQNRSSSSSSSNSTTQTAGSVSSSMGDVNISATGAKNNPDADNNNNNNDKADGNITLIGMGDAIVGIDENGTPIINAGISGNNITLNAKQDLNVLSSIDRFEQDSKNQSSGWSIGASVSGKDILSYNASANQSDGMHVSSATTHNNSSISATGTLSVNTGGDVNAAGAQLSGHRVETDIQGDLNLKSEQDIVNASVEQNSSGINASTSGTANLNISQADGKARFESVNKQSGITAGDGGYDIKVAGNTDLTGAKIVSSAEADNKQLSTATLSHSNIDNKAEYQVESKGLSLGTSSYSVSPGKEDKGGDASTTKAVVDGNISINAPAQQNQSLDDLARSDEDAHRALQQNPDINQVLADQQAMTDAQQQASQAAAKTVGDIGTALTKKYNDARLKRTNAEQALKQAQASGDAEAIKAAQQGIAAANQTLKDNQASYDLWKDGGPARVALHMSTQAFIAQADGQGEAAAAGVLAYEVAANIVENIARAQGVTDQDTINRIRNMAAIAAGALVGGSTGASVATNVEEYNRQLHQAEIDKIHEIVSAKCKGDKKCESEWTKRLTSQALKMVDALWHSELEGEPDVEALKLLYPNIGFNTVDDNGERKRIAVDTSKFSTFTDKEGREVMYFLPYVDGQYSEQDFNNSGRYIGTYINNPQIYRNLAKSKEGLDIATASVFNALLDLRKLESSTGGFSTEEILEILLAAKNEIANYSGPESDNPFMKDSKDQLEEQYDKAYRYVRMFKLQDVPYIDGDVLQLLTSLLTPPEALALLAEGKLSKDALKSAIKKAGTTSKGKAGDGNVNDQLTPRASHASSTESLIEHNTTGTINRGKNRIDGCHSVACFEELAKKEGVRYTQTPVTGQPGVYQITYEIPSKDKAGNLTGSYKTPAKDPKTVYDSNVLSDQKVAEMSQKAMGKAEFPPNETQASVSVDGYRFRVYKNANEEITNAHIVE